MDPRTKKLTTLQRYVTQQKGTEPPFFNRYWKNKRAGLYRCIVCDAPLFASSTKFDSNSGWPSFYAPVDPASVEQEPDRSMGMVRTEVHCAACNAHLGHVFDEANGTPTGLRYCMNSASLRFEE